MVRDAGQAIHCRVNHRFLPEAVTVSFVYASCLARYRMNLWADLVSFAEAMEGSWMVGGDFNVVQAQSEIACGS